MSQKAFLNRSHNKQKFIDLLAIQLEVDHHTVVRCTGDTDTAVVFTTLDHAYTGSNVELIAADTDVLIMLIHIWNNLMGGITIKPEAKKKQKSIDRDIGNSTEYFGDA